MFVRNVEDGSVGDVGGHEQAEAAPFDDGVASLRLFGERASMGTVVCHRDAYPHRLRVHATRLERALQHLDRPRCHIDRHGEMLSERQR